MTSPTLLALALLIDADPSAPTGLTASVGPGPYLVGQPIEVRVEVAGTSGGTIEPPMIADAVVRELPREPVGSARRFVVVPRRPGPVIIPPFRLKLDDRTVASRPIRLTVASVPASGRTPAFLGGVGAFEVRAEAEPATVRVGQTLEYRLIVSGPAAWGSLRGPDLSPWATLQTRCRVEALPPGEPVGDPPSRTFRYRLRPTVGGRFVLPPVAVAAFDPKTQGYATRYTVGVPIRVEEPPRFDRAGFHYGDDRASGGVLGLVTGFWIVATLGSTLILLVLARRARRRRPVDPVQLAAELASGLDATGDAPEVAGRATVALARFLERAGGRPEGALTPPEAREHVERLTRDPQMALRAGRLVERCDRARFGGPTGSGGEDLAIEARRLLIDLGGAMKRREGETEGGSRGR